ncbi:amidohydrolase [Primorskyibacter flagellatus]|uniref:Amidohydrolase n=1 Tax=Primorskyibacter flagellatus TaxID=1387277 RepID=A0A917AE03_9RHOB|nr:M20 aminoacylase family protein [Primorskyibacter flagellatus]GGE45254.1 amidohydrolase [Primorskyibacter flagellatus]
MPSLSHDALTALTALRRQFHAIPEMGFEEVKTSDLICRTLDDMGVPYVRGIGGTGIVATLRKGTSTRSIGLRADIDALPIREATNLPYRSTHEGRMHACGHDGHTTMLLGAIRALLGTDFDGTVQFIFQPAEEHGKGAIAMMQDGLFDRFPMDAVYGLHNMPWLDAGKIALNPGPIMGAEDNFVIRIRGQGGHAAMPHRTRDPMTIAASVVCELQTIVARNVDPLQGAVVSCTEFLTDGAVNVIPTEVTIKGDTRSFLPEVSQLIEERMHRIAKGLCDAHGAELEFTYDRVFPSTVNSPAEAALAATAAASALGAGNVAADTPPMMASEDFGAMLRARPGCYAFIGNRGADGRGGIMLHNAGYDFNDAIIPDGVAYWVSLVEKALPA